MAKVSAAWTGPRGPKLRLLPRRRSPSSAIREQAGPARPPDAARRRREQPRADRPRPRRGVRTSTSSETATPASPRCCAPTRARSHGSTRPTRPSCSSSTTAAPCSASSPTSHLAEYLTTEDQVTAEIEGLTAFLRTRLPGPDVTPEQLRSRSWWSGAEVVHPRRRLRPGRHLGRQPAAPARAPARPGRRRRSAPRRHPPQRWRLSGDVTSRCSRRCATWLSPASCWAPLRRGRTHRRPSAIAAAAGRGRIVSRELGKQVLQLAWQPPRMAEPGGVTAARRAPARWPRLSTMNDPVYRLGDLHGQDALLRCPGHRSSRSRARSTCRRTGGAVMAINHTSLPRLHVCRAAGLAAPALRALHGQEVDLLRTGSRAR